jgi:hypothetical protein
MIFRRIIEIEETEPPRSHRQVRHNPALYKERVEANNTGATFPSATGSQIKMLGGPNWQETKQKTALNRKRKREYARSDELELDLHLENIRRVRIQTVSRGITERFEGLHSLERILTSLEWFTSRDKTRAA